MQGESVRVLLVEDNPVDVLIVRRMLAKSKTLYFDIVAVDDHTTARAHLDSGEFDICLMDRALGLIDGLELVEGHVRTNDKTPIIMLTGMDDVASDIAAMERGAADFVPKEEMSPCTLERSIRYVLKNRRLQDRLRAMAELDPVTGLRSRAGFDRELAQATTSADQDQDKVGLLYIDLDRFKPINDRLGHAAGDLVLRHVADCLQRASSPGAFVSRVGGDEFAIILPAVTTRGTLSEICERLGAAVEQVFEVHGESVSISASFGAALFPDDATEPRALVEAADLAMYEVKRERQAEAA